MPFVITHNLWIGELEKTLFERMCTIQKLRGLIASCKYMGHQVQPFVDRLGTYLNPQVKGTVFEDLTPMTTQQTFDGNECQLEKVVLEHLQKLLVHMGKISQTTDARMPAKARQYNAFRHQGAIFSPLSFSVRDSHAVIGKGIPGDWCAGQIKQIFTYSFEPLVPQEAYLVVQKFRELSAQEATRDPYRRYPNVGGRLYHPELNEEIEVVTLQDIIAHFAYTPHDRTTFGFPCFHALPLNKVSFSSHQLSNTDLISKCVRYSDVYKDQEECR
jgi:hypothetical protein